MVKYVVVVIKIILISSGFVLIGNFIINNLLNFNIDWAINILSILAGMIAVYIWHDTISKDNVLEDFGTIQNKIMAGILLVVLLIIAYFPDSQGINDRIIDFLFLLFAFLITAPFWWYLLRREKRKTVSKVDRRMRPTE